MEEIPMTMTAEELRKRARAGDLAAQNALGNMYLNRTYDEKKNKKKAVKQFKEAAKKGYDKAQYNLGRAYENGWGVRKNDVKAYTWYYRAAEQKHNEAMEKITDTQIIAKATAKANKSWKKRVVLLSVSVIIIILGVWFFSVPILQRTQQATDYLQGKYNSLWSNPLSPVFEMDEWKISTEPLYGNETDTLSFRIKNKRERVNARDITIRLSSRLRGLSFDKDSVNIPFIPGNGKEKVEILISGAIDLPATYDPLIEITLSEPERENQKLKHELKRLLEFETREFRKPDLILTDYSFSEALKKNEQINKNEAFKLEFYVMNTGCGAAENVSVEAVNTQGVVTWEGTGDDYRKENPKFPTIDAGEYEQVTYHYFIGKFDDRELEFKISASESFGEYGFEETVKLTLHKELEGLETPKPSPCDEEPYQKLRVINLDEVPEESQVADRENNRQGEAISPKTEVPKTINGISGIVLGTINEDSFLNLDAEISGDVFTSPNPPAPFYTIKLEFSMHNVSYDVVKQVEVKVENDQKGVDPFNSDPKDFSTIDSQERKPITYEYFIDKEEFNDHEFKFEIHVTYRYLSYIVLNETNIDTIDTATEENKENWNTKKQGWEIKRQVAPDSETEVTELY